MAVKPSLHSVEVKELLAYEAVQVAFFIHPDKTMTLTELKKKLPFAKKTLSEVVKRLGEEGFLYQRVVGKAWQLQVVKGHKYFTTRKISMNLRLIYETGVVDAILAKWPSARAIVLFGSYRQGADIDGSDVDIAVEVPEKTSTQVIELGRTDLHDRKGVRFNCTVFSRQTVDQNLFVNIANGVVLAGLLEVQP